MSGKFFIRNNYTGNNFERATGLHFASTNYYNTLSVPSLDTRNILFQVITTLFFKSTLESVEN